VSDGGRRWLQYWTFYAYNPQDRGVLRTGRHEGDWEMVQLRLSAAGRPDLAVYAQHSWREACPATRVRMETNAPVVFVASGSHAAYFTPGVHNRPWPDPNDHAAGNGARMRPALVRIARDSPAWMRRPHPWGDSRSSLPGEQSSPLGPRFQIARFAHPARWAASARACGSGAPGHPAAAVVALVTGWLWFAAAIAAGIFWAIRGRRRAR
jgi:hypothetical protein